MGLGDTWNMITGDDKAQKLDFGLVPQKDVYNTLQDAYGAGTAGGGGGVYAQNLDNQAALAKGQAPVQLDSKYIDPAMSQARYASGQLQGLGAQYQGVANGTTADPLVAGLQRQQQASEDNTVGYGSQGWGGSAENLMAIRGALGAGQSAQGGALGQAFARRQGAQAAAQIQGRAQTEAGQTAAIGRQQIAMMGAQSQLDAQGRLAQVGGMQRDTAGNLMGASDAYKNANAQLQSQNNADQDASARYFDTQKANLSNQISQDNLDYKQAKWNNTFGTAQRKAGLATDNAKLAQHNAENQASQMQAIGTAGGALASGAWSNIKSSMNKEAPTPAPAPKQYDLGF